MRAFWGICLACAVALPVAGQDRAETLADIRQELNVLYVDIQRLRRELATTGAPQGTGGGSVLERVDAIERALQQLTGKTEQLEFRIGRIVEDGTNRIGDLEFRLVELEGGDVSQLGTTTTLGGEVPASTPAAPLPATSPEAQLAAQELTDFQQAQKAFDAGDFHTAADLFGQFNVAYPGGPMAVRADLRRGQSLSAIGDTREGARAYLAAFSANQTGEDAPEALFLLGEALGALGSPSEACVTLGEVGARFPASPFAGDAQAEMQALGCS